MLRLKKSRTDGKGIAGMRRLKAPCCSTSEAGFLQAGCHVQKASEPDGRGYAQGKRKPYRDSVEMRRRIARMAPAALHLWIWSADLDQNTRGNPAGA
jgi:hypothetical protein